MISKEDVTQLLDKIVGKPFNLQWITMAYDFYNEIFNVNYEKYKVFIRHEKKLTNPQPCECHYDILELLAAWCDYKWK